MIPTMPNPPGPFPEHVDAGSGSTHPHDRTQHAALYSGDPISCGQTYADDCASPSADSLVEEGYARLLHSFDTIVRLHERAEQIRCQLGLIDTILFKARTVSGLVESLIPSLQESLDLVAVRLFVREGNPIASALRLHMPLGVEIVLDDFMKDGGQQGPDLFVLDDPAGDLAGMLFGDAAPLIASAAVAHLGRREDNLGILCLGSNDPARYCASMNTDLVAELAHKVSLGLYNAWDHESAVVRAIDGHTPDVYSDPFFQAYLSKEFARAWRNHSCFCLMAISVESRDEDPTSSEAFLVTLLKNALRSSDLVARGQPGQFWALLPETGTEEARCAAQRILLESSNLSRGNTVLRFGIAEFSRNAPTQSALIREALCALKEATDRSEPIMTGPSSATA